MRINFNESGHEVVDEVVTRSSSTPERIGHDLIKFTGFNVWTGPGMTGTQLVVGTHFSLSVKDEKRSTRVGFALFTLFAVTDAAYLNVPLYLTYTTCGDYLSVENIGEAALPSINLFTTDAVDLSDMKIRERRLYRRMAATSTTQIALSAPGTTIEGRSELRLYGQYSYAILERVSATEFVVVDLKDEYVWDTSTGAKVRRRWGQLNEKEIITLTPPSAGSGRYILHGLDVEKIVSFSGSFYSSVSGNRFPLGFISNDGTRAGLVGLYVNSTAVVLDADVTLSAVYTTLPCEITIWYKD